MRANVATKVLFHINILGQKSGPCETPLQYSMVEDYSAYQFLNQLFSLLSNKKIVTVYFILKTAITYHNTQIFYLYSEYCTTNCDFSGRDVLPS